MSGLHDEDFFAWAEQQAEALKSLSGRPDLPNQLDLGNLAEEIADLGLHELNAAKSLLRNILAHLLVAWADGEAESVAHWHAETAVWQIDLRDRLTPAMRQRIDLDALWRQALETVGKKLAAYRRDPARRRLATLGATAPCPYSLDDLCSDTFDVGSALTRLPPNRE